MPDLTHDDLLRLVDYDPHSGIMVRRSKPPTFKGHDWWNARYAGAVVGKVDKHGYLHVKIKSRWYFVHRLAWFYVHGVWPQDTLDHTNCIRTDNRISNLTEMSREENSRRQWTLKRAGGTLKS